MSLIRNLVIASAIGTGAYQVAGPGPGQSAAAEFVPLPVAEQRQGAVYVTLAENCPREDSQRAERLATELERNGVQVVRTNKVAFAPPGEDPEAIERISAVMKGRLPIVFVDGRAAANPTAQQVIAELKGKAS